MAETAVVSSRKSRLKQKAQEGNRAAANAYKLAKRPTRFLATVQIAITLIGILSGAYAEDKLATDLNVWLQQFSFLSGAEGIISKIILVGCLTYFSLVVGELVPKRLALMYPETIATFIAAPMRIISRVASPLVKLLSYSTDVILKILRVKPPEDMPVTPEELKVLIQEGTDAGVFDKTEQDLMSNVFRLTDRRASSVMTPRTDIVYLNDSDSQEELREKLVETPYAFYPVTRGNLDSLIGVISSKDILTQLLSGEDINLMRYMKKPLIVPEGVSILQMLDAFRQNPSQVALIADEYGSFVGMVTQNDIVESIVGDLPSPEDIPEPDVVVREDGSCLINGWMAAGDMREKLNLPELPGGNHYDTVAGFILMQLQHIPAVGDYFDWQGYRFEVVDMDGRRIDKVLVTMPAQQDEEEADED